VSLFRPVPRLPLARTLLVALACGLTLGFSRPAPAHAATTAEVQLLHAMNNARAARGLVRLRLGSGVQTGAHSWAWYLLRHDAFRHGSLSAGTSENIGWLTCRSGWAAALVRMWLASPGHRANLLDRSARLVGVGVARGSWQRYACVRMAVTRFR
jgi:uncharacterized protein YkwD